MTVSPGDPRLVRLDQDFFRVMHSADPLSATMLGVSEYDSLLPDPSREGAHRNQERFRRIQASLEAISEEELSRSDRTDRSVLAALCEGARAELEHGLWEANASASGYVSPQALVFQAMPAAEIKDTAGEAAYLARLKALPGYFDAILSRYREAKADGRLSTRVGVLQAVDQLDAHLQADPAHAPLLHPHVSPELDREPLLAQAASILSDGVHPALRRLRAGLQDELLEAARGDDQVGIRFVPGGEEGYRAAVRRHTTTALTPERIHQLGLERIAELAQEWSELGARVLGTSEPVEVRRRLREDPSLRFAESAQIVEVVTRALERAEAARDDWFPAFQLSPCVVEEISPLERNNAPLAYYRPPSDDGSRPGAHCVLTADPEQRFSFEYEALAFHESSPGHHLQVASARTLTGVPAYRRFLDAELCAYGEGWGLYCERLADEMGLYSSDLQRLGMLSFEALRACRLVVDTGIHQLGWSRQRAIDYMWQNTATPQANVRNEIDRYIAWPGQALSYMVGCRELRRLRASAEQQLGDRFDPRGFHGAVLGQGPLPLGVLGTVVADWVDEELSRAGAGRGGDRPEPGAARR